MKCLLPGRLCSDAVHAEEQKEALLCRHRDPYVMHECTCVNGGVCMKTHREQTGSKQALCSEVLWGHGERVTRGGLLGEALTETVAQTQWREQGAPGQSSGHYSRHCGHTCA